jgi:putative ABC transport system permease protein
VALGATRSRLVRHLLAEGAVIAIAGGLLALCGVRLFRGTLPAELLQLNPGWTRIAVDARALAVTLGVPVASVVLTGLVPAVIASRADPHDALVAGGRGSAAGVDPMVALRIGIRISRGREIIATCSACIPTTRS